MQYAHSIKDKKVSRFFADKAEEEGQQAHKLQEFIASYNDKSN
jgi:ferritin